MPGRARDEDLQGKYIPDRVRHTSTRLQVVVPKGAQALPSNEDVVRGPEGMERPECVQEGQVHEGWQEGDNEAQRQQGVQGDQVRGGMQVILWCMSMGCRLESGPRRLCMPCRGTVTSPFSVTLMWSRTHQKADTSKPLRKGRQGQWELAHTKLSHTMTAPCVIPEGQHLQPRQHFLRRRRTACLLAHEQGLQFRRHEPRCRVQ